MTRGEAVIYLSEAWPGLASALGVTATDDAAGWKSAVDAALRALGVATADLAGATVSVADEPTFLALLNVFGARRLLVEATLKVDVSVADVGISKRYSQMRDGLAALLALYERDSLVVALVGSVPQMVMGRMTLDYLEPATEWS